TSCVVVNGGTQGADSTPRDVIRSETRTLQNDPGGWWLGQVVARYVLSDFLGTPFALDDTTCLLTGTSAHACAASPPAGPAAAPSADSKIQNLCCACQLMSV